MGEVVNLRTRRKAEARAAQQQKAAANRAIYGRSKAEQVNDAADTERRETLLNGARLSTVCPPPEREGE